MDNTYIDPAPQMPERVIVNIQEDSAIFQMGVEHIEHLDFDLVVMVADIMDNISSQTNAHLYIAAAAREQIQDAEDNSQQNDLITYAREWERFAQAVFLQFQQYCLYYHGRLYYELEGLDKTGNLIMKKLQVPMTDEIRNARRIARQAAAAHQRYQQQTDLRAQIASQCASHREEEFAEDRAYVAVVNLRSGPHPFRR